MPNGEDRKLWEAVNKYPPIPPPPTPPTFEKRLAEWEKKTQLYQEQAKTSQQQLTDYGKQLEALSPRAPTSLLERVYQAGRPLILEWGPLFPSSVAEQQAKQTLSQSISQATVELETSDFFARLYSEVPIAISAGLISSPDELLTMLTPPAALTADELADVRNTISNMIATITKPPELPQVVTDAEELEYPPLVAPPPVTRIPISMHQLSTQELLKSLKIPRAPESAMTKEEWESFLRLKGYTDEDIDMEMQLLAEELITSWQDRNNQLEAFRTGLAEMPEYKVTDMLKEMVVQPGLALAELAMIYFEHVSMPLAGKLYKNFIPDLEAEYVRFKQANPDVSDREALVHAWIAWDAPFEGAAEWILKYMLMEGLVDPLTYAGWGIAARLTKPIPYVGRFVGAAERGIASVFEAPFDVIKWGVRKFPKTLTQRATMAQHQASQYVERYLTRSTGRHLSSMSMKDLTDAAERAIKYALNNPQLEDDIALAGREMLKHAPVDERLVMDWSSRLGTTLRSEDITRVTVENVDNLFEDMFARKLITEREAAGQLLKVFNVGDMSDTALKTAQRILEARTAAVQRGAIAFTRAKTPLAAMRVLTSKNFRTHIAMEESVAALARKETGAFSTLLHNTDLRLQGIWRNGIDRWVVRPFAESYLTFGMYGPMNILEDYFRSALGGVVPRRMNIEAWEKLTIGLRVDPELKRYGISEMIGPLAREGPEQNWNNWILQLFALGQKGWADKIYKTMVRLPGAYGMDVRRNFMSKRYLQLLAEAGGEEFKALAKVGPRNLPKLADRKLVKDLEATVYSLKTTGNPDAIRGAKDLFTRRRVVRNEVGNILKEHPNLPNTARDYIMRAYDEDIIFREAGESIEKTITETRGILLDTFIREPEMATLQYRQLADVLTALEVRNPQEMATAIHAVHRMSEIYGAYPDQIIAQATIRSRGLPLAERRATFDADFDRLYQFLDAAGADIDRVVNKLRLTAIEPAKVGVIDWSGIRFGAGISPKLERDIRVIVDRLPLEIKANLKEIRISRQYRDVGAFYEPVGGIIHFTNAEIARNPQVVYHELGHGILDIHPEKARIIADFRSEESFAMKFGLYCTDPSIVEQPFRGLLDDLFPKLQRELPLTEGYKDASTRLFDIMTTKREYATEFRAQNMATRHEIFAGVSKKEMTSDFWDGFYLQMNNEYRLFNLRMAELDGQLVRSIEEMNIAAGAKITPRASVVVKDRPLAPQDIATLLGVRGDDISRALLDVLTVQNNKDFFVAYVRGMTRPGDIGFTKEAVEAVYDQIAYSLRVSPESMSWITSKQIELDGVRKELHSLYNSKVLPDDEIAAIGKYLDGTADAVEKLMFGELEPTVVSRIAKLYLSSTRGKTDYALLEELSRDLVAKTGRAIGKLKDKGRFPERIEALSKATTPRDRMIEFDNLMGEFHAVLDRTPDYVDFPATFVKEVIGEDDVLFALFVKDVIAEGTTRQMERIAAGYPFTVTKGKIRIGERPPTKAVRPEYANFDDLRQTAMDEAHKWYYKEYPDYTNANAFDALMKTIYPYWTYESQRWFWLPRAFVRHPGIFTTFERWQNNSDYGYIHIPNTSIDINPFRGTIFGTATTRLVRRDFPEYYDSLGAAGGLVEFNDYLSRFGFYPGAHIGIPLALMGGLEQQMGETLPAIWKTPLNALIAAFPKSESVKWLSEHLFSDRFREYMTILETNKRGYNGSHIWVKVRENLPLTEEEQAVWDSARGEAALHGVGFEQFGLFRLRSDEQYRAYEESAKAIEEITGYTPDQQNWLRRHGYRIWDMVGGLSPTNQAILQELESYKWLGTVTPLLPSRQQLELRRLDLDWDDVMQFAESGRDRRLQLQQEFLLGRIGPRDYTDRLQTSYTEQRDYIDKKMEENPNMTLEGRKDYYKKYGIPIPVQHPMRELLNLYFSIELNTEAIDPETGEISTDWDSFFAQRAAIEDAILPELKEEWESYLSRNTTRLEEIRRDVSNTYLRKYYDVWEATLGAYPENEQKLINEFLYLERTGQQLKKQGEIKEMISTKTGNQLISSFRSDVSDSRAALRYANPHLDAWLFFWGRVTSFKTPQAEAIYRQISKDTGRVIE